MHSVNPAEVMEVMERTGAVMNGHFRLSSGKHSDVYVEKFRVLEQPRLAQSLGEAIARQVGGDIDLVASPAVGAVVLGFATALAADRRFIFAERSGGVMAFRRGFALHSGARVLVVEDVITTGGSAREVVDLVRSAGGTVVGVGCLLDRSDPASPPALGAPLRSLARLSATAWEAQECPLCRRSQPFDDPGSRRLGGAERPKNPP